MNDPWTAEALCAQVGGDLWSPNPGTQSREAKHICNHCPIQNQCLQHALDNDERFGIWGGLSPNEREKVKRRRRRLAVN